MTSMKKSEFINIIDKIIRCVEEEEELPGPMENEMYYTIKEMARSGDREGLEEAFRILVRVTKDNIKKRIVGLFENGSRV